MGQKRFSVKEQLHLNIFCVKRWFTISLYLIKTKGPDSSKRAQVSSIDFTTVQ